MVSQGWVGLNEKCCGHWKLDAIFLTLDNATVTLARPYSEVDTLPLSHAIPSRELVKVPVCVLKPCETNREQEEEPGSGQWGTQPQISLLPIKVTSILTEKLSSLTSQDLRGKM